MVVARRAVWLDVPPDVLENRHKSGLDRLDEVWQGVLHMVPPPAFEHATIEGELAHALKHLLEELGLAKVRQNVGVRPAGSGTMNFRVPDISVLSPKRKELVYEGWINGGPELVVEIRSPNDETYEKMPFYAALEIDELLVIDRDSRRLELYRLAGKQYVAVSSNADGWLPLTTFPIALGSTKDAQIEVEDRASPARSIHTLNLDA
jgi:Uma2 family endonuclease